LSLITLESSLVFSARQGQPLSLVMADVDRFKAYNDDHGHRAGDEALRGVAAVLRAHARPSDLVARYGGEEFAVLLPATDADAGRAVAERLRAAVAAYPWPGRAVTASFGVATTHPGAKGVSDLEDEADQALYHSKHRGRDRVTHLGEVGVAADAGY